MSTELVGRWPAHVSREQITDTAEAVEHAPPAHDEALDFVRFCYRRRHVAWPDLYDEMCAVASRGAFRGLGYAELVDHGISFCLGDLPKLAMLTERVVREEQALLEGRAAAAVPMMLACSRPGADPADCGKIGLPWATPAVRARAALPDRARLYRLGRPATLPIHDAVTCGRAWSLWPGRLRR